MSIVSFGNPLSDPEGRWELVRLHTGLPGKGRGPYFPAPCLEEW